MYVVDGIAYAGEPTEDLEVSGWKYTGNFTMLFTFTTGETRLFDVTPLFDLEAFKPLANESIFSHPAIDHGVPTWCEGEIDLSPSQIYSMSYSYDRVA